MDSIGKDGEKFNEKDWKEPNGRMVNIPMERMGKSPKKRME